MNYSLRLLVVFAVLFSLVGVPTAASGDSLHSSSFYAAIDGWEAGFVPGDLIPEGRCPIEAQWMLLGAGGGEAERYGTFEFTSAHCSWPITLTPSGAVGKLAAGEMVLTFDEGTLVLGYEGTWKFDGDLSSGEGIAKVAQRYQVIDGSGMFEGAFGHGSVVGVDDFHHLLFDIKGSLHIER